MLDWWEQHGPPVYIAVAAYLGLVKEPAKETTVPAGNLDGIEKFFDRTGMLH
jgi:hypothetical protein